MYDACRSIIDKHYQMTRLSIDAPAMLQALNIQRITNDESSATSDSSVDVHMSCEEWLKIYKSFSDRLALCFTHTMIMDSYSDPRICDAKMRYLALLADQTNEWTSLITSIHSTTVTKQSMNNATDLILLHFNRRVELITSITSLFGSSVLQSIGKVPPVARSFHFKSQFQPPDLSLLIQKISHVQILKATLN